MLLQLRTNLHLLVLLLTGGILLQHQVVQGQTDTDGLPEFYAFPDFRYVDWTTMGTTMQGFATTLGYTEDTWKDFDQPAAVEGESWDTLSNQAAALSLGFVTGYEEECEYIDDDYSYQW